MTESAGSEAPGVREGLAAERPSRVKTALRVLLGVAMIGVGVTHFTGPEGFVRIVPPWLPSPLALVYVSGVAEIAGGAGLFVPRLRRAASWGLIALYVAVFPANLHMALHGLPLGDYQPSPIALWARLPFQLVFIAWAWWVGRPDAKTGAKIDAKIDARTGVKTDT